MVYMFRNSRKEDRGLPGRVSSSDDDDLPVAAKQRFHRGRGIVDPLVFEILMVLHVESSVPRSACDHYRACANSQTASKDQPMQAIHLRRADNVTRDGEPNSELERLEMAAARQLCPRNATSEIRGSFQFSSWFRPALQGHFLR